MQTEAFIDTNVFLRFLIFDKSNPNMSELARKAFLMLKEGKIILYTNALIIADINNAESIRLPVSLITTLFKCIPK